MRLFALFLLFVRVLCPQGFELSASAGLTQFGSSQIGFLGFGEQNRPLDEVRLRNGWMMAGRMTFNTSERFGHEFGMGYTRHPLTAEVGAPVVLVMEQPRSVLQLFHNFLVYIGPEDAGVRPFFGVGPVISQFRARAVFRTLGRQESTEYGLNYGGGFKFRVRDNSFVRVDVREHATPKPLDLIDQRGWLRERELSVGMGLRF